MVNVKRREFAFGLAGTCLLAGGLRVAAPASSSAKKKIAFLGTEVFEHSHSQHFLDRFHLGWATGGSWRESQVEVAGVYIEQFRDRDVGRERLAKYGLTTYPTLAEALTLGGSELAVDGVVIIGEHGEYPRNEKGQTLYPRYKWFKEVVEIFERSGRSVPIFNDKHLSTDWAECQEMVDDSKRLEFPFYAGSSLPVTWRLPELELPLDVPLEESVCVAYGGVDSYDFHALETAQCMSERRVGGEVGIAQVHALRGDKVWEKLATEDATRELFLSALCRSHSLPVYKGYPSGRISLDWARENLTEMVAYFIEHRDGFRTSIYMTNIQDFNYAGRRSDNGQIVGCQMMLPMPGRNATTADFFNPLSLNVEQMIVHGKTAYPVERTLLTSGMVIGGVDSLFQGEVPIATPEMSVVYRAPQESMFWRQATATSN